MNPRRWFRRVGEQTATLLRKFGGWGTFWRTKGMETTEVDFELARQLYSNSNTDYTLGAGFCRRIIDGSVEFMGLPRASSDDEELDDWLNDSIHQWWPDEIQQIFRNAMRDSKSIVRMVPYDWRADPLISSEDDDRVKMEVIEPERVRVYYNLVNAEIVDMAQIEHNVPFYENPPNDQPWSDPSEEIHQITEVITRERVDYWDVTTGEWITEWGHSNEWGFVPVHEVYNEWDSTLGRGQSDYEAVFPFIKAFHDVMYQSLQAHAYHSIPKVKFRIDDIDTFIRNNFPSSIDETTGEFTGTVQWQGKEILFMQSQEDASFLEAQSVLGDSKTLMEFLFDCICVASETAAWVLMRTEQGTSGQRPQDAVSWIKRVERKRHNFSSDLRKIFKMALVMSGRRPIHVKLSWDAVRPEDEAAWMQALQQMVMALEIAAQRGILSDETYRAAIRPYIAAMKNPVKEAADAKSNVMLMETATMNGNGSRGNIPVTQGQQGANE